MPSRTLYALAVRAATPLMLGRLLWRSRRAPAYRQRWPERLGFGPWISGRPIWVHAVSLGETIAAEPLVRGLLAQYPERPLLVTNTTPTGAERTRALFGDAVSQRYLPWDTAGAVRRFLARADPCAGILMETEIWPNLLAEAHARGVPMALVNARLSARSARGYARLPLLTADALDCLDVVAAQTRADAERFCSLGAAAERVHVTGNLKFDQQVPAEARDKGSALRSALGAGRPVWLAASTHEGEEAMALAAHAQVRARHPDAALILVPRHPERFDAVAELIRQRGHPMARRSRGEVADAGVAVYLGDTTGELPALMAASDIAFVGGSLVPTGGHNLLEPAALGMPVISGPHLFNFSEISSLLLSAAALEIVEDSEALGERVAALFADATSRQRAGAAAAAVIRANRGARERVLNLIKDLLLRR